MPSTLPLELRRFIAHSSVATDMAEAISKGFTEDGQCLFRLIRSEEDGSVVELRPEAKTN